MPIVTRNSNSVVPNINNQRLPTQEEREISLGETFGAAFRQENTVVSFLNNTFDGTPEAEFDSNFDPFENIEGFEEFASDFALANSELEVNAIKRQIKREQADRDIIADSGAIGFLAALTAGIVDPINLVPFGSIAYKTYRTGGSILQGALATGTAGVLGATAAEAALHHNQITRTLGESATNVAGTALLSGLLGGAAASLSRPAYTELASRLERELVTPKDGEIDPLDGGFLQQGDGSGGAADARLVTNKDLTIAPALGLEKLLAFQDPLLRTMVKGSLETKRAVVRLVENPLKTNQNMKGFANTVTPPVETKVKLDDADLIKVIQKGRESFLAYRTRMAGRKQSSALTTVKDITGISKKQAVLNRFEFMEEVAFALRNKGQHEIPEVEQAAKFYRDEFFEPWRKKLEEIGRLPEGVTEENAISYLMRLYDIDKINARPAEFKKIHSDYLREQRDLAPAKIAELEKQIKQRRQEVKNRIAELTNSKKAKNADIKAVEKEIAELRKARDKDVETLKKDIKKIRRDLRKFDEDIEARAGQIVMRIKGSPAGRLPYDIDFGDLTQPTGRGSPRKGPGTDPTKARAYDIDDFKIQDFLVNDIEQIAKVYKRSVSPDYHLTRDFGDVEMTAELKAMQDEFQADVAKIGDNFKKQEARRKRFHADTRDVVAMRDRIRGIYGAPADPTNGFVRAGRVARNINYVRLMGGVLISSIPDIGAIILRNGLGTFMRAGLVPLITNLKNLKMSAAEAKIVGEAGDLVIDGRTQFLGEIADGTLQGGRFERGIQQSTDIATRLFGISHWNAGLKQFTAAVIQARMYQMTKALINGTATKREISDMAAAGVDKRMAKRWQLQLKKYGQKDGSLVLSNTDRWDDRTAAEAWNAALSREIRKTIITPGQDKPLWMSTELGKFVGQFRSFAFASMQRVALSSLQDRDLQTLVGIISIVGLGIGVHILKSVIAGREIETSPDALIAEGIDRSGITGWFFDANNSIEKLTDGGFGVSRLLGKTPQGRYINRNKANVILGPSIGLFTDAAGVLGAVGRGDFGAQDVSAIRRMLFLQNVFYLRSIFDEAERAIINTFGLE